MGEDGIELLKFKYRGRTILRILFIALMPASQISPKCGAQASEKYQLMSTDGMQFA